MKNEERAAVIDLGIKADSFVKDDTVGVYLLNRAAQEAHDALMQFKNVSVTNVSKIRDLQSSIKRYDDLERWLSEAINAGNAEYEQYLEENR